MTLLDSLLSQGMRAWREPRQAAADVIALGVPRDALVPGLVVVVILSALINAAAEYLAPSPLGSLTHYQMAVFLLVLLAAFALGVCKIGQAMGGIGTCSDSLLLAVFFQAMFIPAQILQVVLMGTAPVLAGLLAMFLFFFGIWVNVNFIAALHGFPTLGKAVAVLVFASFVVAIALLGVAPLLGISLFAGGAARV